MQPFQHGVAWLSICFSFVIVLRFAGIRLPNALRRMEAASEQELLDNFEVLLRCPDVLSAESMVFFALLYEERQRGRAALPWTALAAHVTVLADDVARVACLAILDATVLCQNVLRYQEQDDALSILTIAAHVWTPLQLTLQVNPGCGSCRRSFDVLTYSFLPRLKLPLPLVVKAMRMHFENSQPSSLQDMGRRLGLSGGNKGSLKKLVQHLRAAEAPVTLPACD
eukprot:s2805_g7.t1